MLDQLDALGHTQDQLGLGGETVTLQQLRGIELNERAAALAELVLWIGYLQWHIRTSGHAARGRARGPRLRQHRAPRCRAGLGRHGLPDDGSAGQALHPLGWPRPTNRPPCHSRTGARRGGAGGAITLRITRPGRPGPQADPLWAIRRLSVPARCAPPWAMATSQALRSAWPEVPESADFVMYWWHRAAAQVARRPRAAHGLNYHQQPAPDL